LPVARGGMAEVWAARLHGSRGFRKLVAIKTILRGAIDDTRMEQMFLAEAELASRIQHPNVVQTLELGEHDSGLYLVLEWVEGLSLSALLSEASVHGGVPLAIAVNLVGQACKGLHAAHELTDENGAPLGVVHRDISPQNVLVSFSGTVKVVDFGIAKATAAASTLTEAGEVKGKLAYMAPEQLRGSEGVDRRADIFALGTLLYAMTTGRHPFRGDHPSATLKNITMRGSVPPPSAHVEDYPSSLEEVVLKALKKDPADRYATAHEMLQALERALPDALERSFDVKVAEFVAKVAGSSGSERYQRIREAGDMLDRLRIKSGASLEQTSPSSLSALAIDGSHVTQQSPLLLGQAPGQPQLPVAQSRSKVWWIAAGAVVCGGVLGLTLAGGPATAPATSNPASAGASVTPNELRAMEPKLAPAPAAASVPPAESGTAEADESAAPAGSERAESAQQKKRVLRAPRGAAPVRTSAKAAVAPSEPVAPAPAPAPAETPRPRETVKPKGNAWDPDSFGARQ